jgi:hypothetical protein
VATYEFECELEILMIWIKLEEAWPWKWRANDGDSLGTYLSTRVQLDQMVRTYTREEFGSSKRSRVSKFKLICVRTCRIVF